MASLRLDIEFKTVEKAVKSWKTVQKIPNYEVVVGQILFKQIFDLAPGAISMFGFGVDVADPYKIPETLFSTPKFIAHASGVVKMLETALTLLLQDEVEDLAEALRGLGSRHVKYGVQAPHYTIVATALLRTLAIGLGAKWTPSLRAKWSEVIKFMTSAMRIGAESAVKIEKVSATYRLTALVSKGLGFGLQKLENIYYDSAKSGKSKKRSPRPVNSRQFSSFNRGI